MGTVSPSFSDRTLTEDISAFFPPRQTATKSSSSPLLGPRLSLRGEKDHPGVFQLVANDEASLSQSNRRVDTEHGSKEWLKLDLSQMSPRVVENWIKSSDGTRRQEKQRHPGDYGIPNAWARRSKEGFIIRLRRKLTRTRDAVAEIHLFQNRRNRADLDQSKNFVFEKPELDDTSVPQYARISPERTRNAAKEALLHQNRGSLIEVVRSLHDAFPREELDSQPIGELACSYTAPRSELSTPSNMFHTERVPSSKEPSTISPRSKRSGSVMQPDSFSSPMTDIEAAQRERKVKPKSPFATPSNPVGSSRSTISPLSIDRLSSANTPTPEVHDVGDVMRITETQPHGNDSGSSSALHRSPTIEEDCEAEAISEATKLSEASMKSGCVCEDSLATTLVRGLSVSQTVRYETGTDAEPEKSSESVETSANFALQEGTVSQNESQEDDSKNVENALQSDEDTTFLREPLQSLTDDTAIEDIWNALIKAQVHVLGSENPLVYATKHQLALSRLALYQDINLTTALEDTRENFKAILGLNHPLVQAFIRNVDLLRNVIMNEACQENPRTGISKMKSPMRPREELSTTSSSSEGDASEGPLLAKKLSICKLDRSTVDIKIQRRIADKPSDGGRNMGNSDRILEEDGKIMIPNATSQQCLGEEVHADPSALYPESSGPGEAERTAMGSKKTLEVSKMASPILTDTVPAFTDNRDTTSGSSPEKSSLSQRDDRKITDEPDEGIVQSSDPDRGWRRLSSASETKGSRSRHVNFQDRKKEHGSDSETRPLVDVRANGEPSGSKPRPRIETKASGFAPNLRSCMKQTDAPFTPTSEPVSRKIQDLFNTSQPPHRIRDSRIIALRLAIAATVRMVLNALFWVLRSFGPETAIPNGKVRVRWTCLCGEQLHDDFIERRPGAARELQAYLNRPREHPSSSPRGSSSISTPSRVYTSSSAPSMPSSATSWSQQSMSSDIFALGNTWRQGSGASHSPRFGNRSTMTPHPPWLLTCASEEKFTPKLMHLNVDPAMIFSDKDLANILRKCYFEVNRKWYRAFLRLRGLTSIEFVRFELHRNRFADINACPDMPPLNQDYEFEPTDLMPPVGSQYFHHLFMHPEEYDDETIAYARIPKKIGGRLSLGQGWGINFVEGFLPHRVWMIILTLLLVSLMFAIIWASWKHDIQGAFGVACYIMALTTVAIAWVEACIG